MLFALTYMVEITLGLVLGIQNWDRPEFKVLTILSAFAILMTCYKVGKGVKNGKTD